MGAVEAYERLAHTTAGEVLTYERMSRHTSLRVGGPASLHVTCDTYSSLRQAVEVLSDEEVPWVIMGRGCSVLVSDEGYDGAVLVLGREFRRFSVDEYGRMHVGAGANLQRVVAEAFDRDLSGLEFAVALPGSVGGALSTNISKGEACIGDIVDEIVTFRPGVGLVRYGADEITWYDRACDIWPREIILEATLRLETAPKGQIKKQMERELRRHRTTCPVGKVTCDALFFDPQGRHAAQLVRDSGLAGYESGHAQVSRDHPNYVINLGGATATDVADVLTNILATVRRINGIELRPQVKFLGFPT